MSKITVVEDTFGTIPSAIDPTKKEIVKRFTLKNEKFGTTLQLINYGATITSLKVPDRDGKLEDIVLGYDSIEGYLGAHGRNPYFGATIGRVANRTAKGKFTLNGKEFQLTVNNGENHLHGGNNGFDKKLWESRVHQVDGATAVTFSCLSQNGEEGYPGDVLANVTFKLYGDTNDLEIIYKASVTQSTPVVFTNHSYFVLSGHSNGDKELAGHSILLNADSYTPINENMIPTGKLQDVEGTKFDFRKTKDLHKLLNEFPEGPNGYDHNFCVNGDSGKMRLVATAQHGASGRMFNVYSTQPGVQFYTANFLPDKKVGDSGIPGKEGATYWKHGAFCLETQNYPDAINHDNFPNSVVHPGEEYLHRTLFQFLTTISE